MADNFDEYLQTLADLSVPEDYDPLDRYRDFRRVFLETDQGRRVLKQILSWGNLLRVPPTPSPIDPYAVMRSEGGRNLALKIFAIMMVEPPARQKTQRTTQPSEET